MAKKGFLDGYKEYDTSNGFGSPAEWKSAFAAAMGMDEAKKILGAQSPHYILGVKLGATWAVIQKAFRLKSMECHPDRCAIHGLTEAVATERFKQLLAAYTVLKARHGQ